MREASKFIYLKNIVLVYHYFREAGFKGKVDGNEQQGLFSRKL